MADTVQIMYPYDYLDEMEKLTKVIKKLPKPERIRFLYMAEGAALAIDGSKKQC
ncbi:MAG: hypothetical protein LKJ75_11490 [Clostridia bacterium]|jgi:ABC-type hemin transport system substrate-binding protein|nr:hypothetical protein [Clostridia bacterium]MCI2015813.1 hypothetical protein [Clostridia bacterium]